MTSLFVRRASCLGPSARCRVFALVWLCGLVAAVPAWARAEAVVLTWNAPPGCSSADDVLTRVRKLTSSAKLPEGQLHAEATVAPREHGRLHLQLRVRAGRLVGERAIDGRTCDDLAGATAVVLSLLLRSAEPLRGGELEVRDTAVRDDVGGTPSTPRATDIGQRAGPPETARATEATEARPETTSEEPAAAHTSRHWRYALQLPLVALGVGPLPGPSFGVSLAGGVLWERWSLLAESSFWLTQALTATDQAGVGAEVHRVEGAVRGCRAFPLGRLEVAPCLRMSVLHLWARGSGEHVAAQTARTSWLAVGAGVQLRYPIARWFRVVFTGDAHLHTARPRLSIDDVGDLPRLRRVAFTVSLGAEWIF